MASVGLLPPSENLTWLMMNSNNRYNAILYTTWMVADFHSNVHTFSMLEKDILLIINPNASKGRGRKSAKLIQGIFKERGRQCTVAYTKGAGHASILAKKGVQYEYKVIIAAGGDGTVNEVLNGIVNTKNILGVLPVGSGNDFYKTLKLNPDGMIKCDVGKINDMYFLNTVCFGVDADVANNIDLMKMKGIPTSRLYVASIIHTLLKFKFKRLNFKVNDVNMSGEFTTLVICNGKFYGNGFKISPNAKVDDGFFDVYYVDKLPKVKLVNLLMKLKNGLHENSPYVHKMRVNNIVVKTGRNVVANVDGEKYLNNEFKIKIIKKFILVYNNKSLIKDLLK